jgi:hypothetical protein
MLGNDVVDLHDPESQPESFRPRFDERVFSEDEQWAIAHDPNPHARRWAHWAAKEAAYKLARQLDSTFVFSPRRLIANFAPAEIRIGVQLERRGHLLLEGCGAEKGVTALRIALRSFETSECIHVVAVPESTDWGAVDYAVSRVDAVSTSDAVDTVDAVERRGDDDVRADSSLAVRKMAIAEIARRLGVDLDRLSIGRRGRIPTVLLDGAETSLSLSLSHHGNWIGYAMALRMESAPFADGTAVRDRRGSSSSPIAPLSQLPAPANRAPTV